VVSAARRRGGGYGPGGAMAPGRSRSRCRTCPCRTWRRCGPIAVTSWGSNWRGTSKRAGSGPCRMGIARSSSGRARRYAPRRSVSVARMSMIPVWGGSGAARRFRGRPRRRPAVCTSSRCGILVETCFMSATTPEATGPDAECLRGAGAPRCPPGLSGFRLGRKEGGRPRAPPCPGGGSCAPPAPPARRRRASSVSCFRRAFSCRNVRVGSVAPDRATRASGAWRRAAVRSDRGTESGMGWSTRGRRSAGGDGVCPASALARGGQSD
jgi:hypothetical protein